jgi:hypothetical protein
MAHHGIGAPITAIQAARPAIDPACPRLVVRRQHCTQAGLTAVIGGNMNTQNSVNTASLVCEDLGERRFDLDWVRIIAFMLLILYHVGMYYVTWDWHVKSPHASHAIEPLMQLTSPWRLSLLFLVSGVATAYLLARQGNMGFLRGRSSVCSFHCCSACWSSCRHSLIWRLWKS